MTSTVSMSLEDWEGFIRYLRSIATATSLGDSSTAAYNAMRLREAVDMADNLVKGT